VNTVDRTCADVLEACVPLLTRTLLLDSQQLCLIPDGSQQFQGLPLRFHKCFHARDELLKPCGQKLGLLGRETASGQLSVFSSSSERQKVKFSRR
jgi:hypothetical protein